MIKKVPVYNFWEDGNDSWHENFIPLPVTDFWCECAYYIQYISTNVKIIGP